MGAFIFFLVAAISGIVWMLNDVKRSLLLITHKINTIMAFKDDLQAFATEMRTSISNIAADIDRLTAGLGDPDLTEVDKAAILSEFGEISTTLKTLADKTPEVPEEPTPEA